MATPHYFHFHPSPSPVFVCLMHPICLGFNLLHVFILFIFYLSLHWLNNYRVYNCLISRTVRDKITLFFTKSVKNQCLYVNKLIKYSYINKIITKHIYIQDRFSYISQFIYVIKIIVDIYIYIYKRYNFNNR